MKTRIAAAATALVLGVAPVSSAMAFGYVWQNPPRTEARRPVTQGVHDAPWYASCPASSAAEGNANQQTRPVKQYGQVSGGYRC